MTVIQSCDHHGPEGTVPSTRSRARMLEQLRAAESFADAFLGLVGGSVVVVKLVDETEGWTPYPTLRWDVDPDRFLATWRALMAWRLVEPTGDDWAPAPEKPPEIGIPPDEPKPL